MYRHANAHAQQSGPRAAPRTPDWMRGTPTLAEIDRITSEPPPSLEDVARAHLDLLTLLEELSGWSGQFRLHIAATKHALGEV